MIESRAFEEGIVKGVAHVKLFVNVAGGIATIVAIVLGIFGYQKIQSIDSVAQSAATARIDSITLEMRERLHKEIVAELTTDMRTEINTLRSEVDVDAIRQAQGDLREAQGTYRGGMESVTTLLGQSPKIEDLSARYSSVRDDYDGLLNEYQALETRRAKLQGELDALVDRLDDSNVEDFRLDAEKIKEQLQSDLDRAAAAEVESKVVALLTSPQSSEPLKLMVEDVAKKEAKEVAKKEAKDEASRISNNATKELKDRISALEESAEPKKPQEDLSNPPPAPDQGLGDPLKANSPKKGL